MRDGLMIVNLQTFQLRSVDLQRAEMTILSFMMIMFVRIFLKIT